jgi:hypothetical protein
MDSGDELRSDVLRFVGRGLKTAPDDEIFNRLAVAAFQRQFAANEPYRRYCERRGATPLTVEHWSSVPAVPTAAFKSAALVCGDAASAEIVFRTSGTSQGVDRRGAHYVRDLSLYRTAALPNFKAHLLPDGAHLRLLILAPPPQIAPDSSLSWMLEAVRVEFGARGSAYFVDEDGFRLEAVVAALEESESKERPIMLLGTAAAFVYLLDALGQRARRFDLPSGSRLMETGGFKRLPRTLSRVEFYAWLADRLGIPETYCVAEYGMTEMCSQFYDNVLREQAHGRPPDRRYKTIAPWVRTQVVDAETLEALPVGHVGALRHFDLANLDSVLAIQTDDLGVAAPQGFEILGRAAGAELRGCSIAMNEWLTAQS